MTSEWLSPLVVPLALLALLRWADKPAVLVAAAALGTAGLRGLLSSPSGGCSRTASIGFGCRCCPVLALLAGAGACWSVRALVAASFEGVAAGRPGGKFPRLRGGTRQRLVRAAGTASQQAAVDYLVSTPI